MADHPTLAFRVRDLPPALRDLPDRAPVYAHGLYNAHLLAGRAGDAVEAVLAALRRKGVIT